MSGPHPKNPGDRFWAKVDKSGECWVWTGCRSRPGYGRITIGRRVHFAHRVSLELDLGRSIAPGIFVCHHCDNPPCVRPDHLFEGTPADNSADAKAKGHMKRSSRLTSEQVWSIRSRRRVGERQASLAREFGVSKTSIHDFVYGLRSGGSRP